MRVIVFTLCLALAGCAVQRAEDAERARSDLIGMSKAEILACAGAPTNSHSSGDTEVLTYSYVGDQNRSEYSVKQRQCSANFVFQGGRVAKLDYTGRTGGLLTQGETCGFIIANCVKP